MSDDHLDPDHRALLILEAPSAEAANDFLLAAGFVHFTNQTLYLLTPTRELEEKAAAFDLPTIY